MSTINAIKIKQADGTYSSEIPIGVSATNVQWDATNSLTDILGTVAYSTKGSIQDQIDDLSGGSGNSLEYVADYVNPTTNVKTEGVVEGDITHNKAAKNSHAEGSLTEATGNYSHAEGYNTKATNTESHAEGSGTWASNSCSHAEGSGTRADGFSSHAEGYSTSAMGTSAHAEGQNTYAGLCSHAEGQSTSASGDWSHAEGCYSTAEGRSSHVQGYGCYAWGGMVDEDEDGEDDTYYGDCSHAEGYSCKCYGSYSHAEGYKTVAERPFTHVEGRLNQLFDDIDEDGYSTVPRYAHIIGGGYYPNAGWESIDTGEGELDPVRRDIHRVDWDGNAWYAGSLTLGNATLTEANLQALLALLS